MIRLVNLAIVAGVALAAAGCATPTYLADRGRDAADILTVTLGTGGGAKARVGPVQVALLQNSDIGGLRAGRFFVDGLDLEVNDEIYVLPFPMANVGVKGWGWPFGLEGFSHGPNSVAAARGKDVFAESRFPCLVTGGSAPYYGQIEVVAGLGFTLHLGLNVVELLDFLVGWVGIDICKDDERNWKNAGGPDVPEDYRIWKRGGKVFSRPALQGGGAAPK